MSVRIFSKLDEWRRFRASPELGGRALGFIPTMGALHEGHLSLMDRSKRENDLTLASIFVNPTQFNDPKDLEKYPRTFERDLAMLGDAGVDFLLYPSYEELYADHYRYKVEERELSGVLCGAHRPGHFDGVLTVVMKLLNLARAKTAYFGEKDYQQLLLVQGMAKAFFLDTDIVGCPTRRETDGLAMSSRNTRLSPGAREKAAQFARVLASDATPEEAKGKLRELGFEIDYVEERLGRRFGAVKIEGVRLIDNVAR